MTKSSYPAARIAENTMQKKSQGRPKMCEKGKFADFPNSFAPSFGKIG
jgi:hypothetical protein